jgi:hypothetical protein
MVFHRIRLDHLFILPKSTPRMPDLQQRKSTRKANPAKVVTREVKKETIAANPMASGLQIGRVVHTLPRDE